MKYKAKIANYRIKRQDDIIRIRPINSTRWLIESILLLLFAFLNITLIILISIFNPFSKDYWILLYWFIIVMAVFIFSVCFIFGIQLFKRYRRDRVKIDVFAKTLKLKGEIFYFDDIMKIEMREIFNDNWFRFRKYDFMKVIQLEMTTYREIPLFFIRGKVHQVADTYSRDIFQKTEAAEDLRTYLEIILQAREKSVLEIQKEEKALIKAR